MYVLANLVFILAVQQMVAAPTIEAPAIAVSPEHIAPLQSGEPAPSFVVRSATGAPFEFNPDALDRPVLIIAFRGGWCPYCNMHLSELRTVVPQIKAMGIDVLFLSGDRPELLYSSLAADTQDDIADLDYQIYSDADAAAATAFGIAFEVDEKTVKRRREKGDDIADSSILNRGILPVPAVFAIDRSGVIRFVFAEADHRIRLPADDLLAVGSGLVQ
jgi:peroxiredoxin